MILGVMTVSEEIADEVGRGNFRSADIIRPRDLGPGEGEEPAQDRAAKLHGLRRPLDCLHLALFKRCRSAPLCLKKCLDEQAACRIST